MSWNCFLHKKLHEAAENNFTGQLMHPPNGCIQTLHCVPAVREGSGTCSLFYGDGVGMRSIRPNFFDHTASLPKSKLPYEYLNQAKKSELLFSFWEDGLLYAVHSFIAPWEFVYQLHFLK